MSRHKRELTLEALELMAKESRRFPVVIRDYCHYESCPTDWYLVRLDKTVKGLEASYRCLECDTKRHYQMKEFE